MSLMEILAGYDGLVLSTSRGQAMKHVKLFVKYGPLLVIAIAADLVSFFVNAVVVLYRILGTWAEKGYKKAIDWCDS